MVVADSLKGCCGILLRNLGGEGPLRPRLLSDHTVLTSQPLLIL